MDSSNTAIASPFGVTFQMIGEILPDNEHTAKLLKLRAEEQERREAKMAELQAL